MYTPIEGSFSILDSLIVAFISIFIVFIVLVVIVAVAGAFSKVLIKIDNKKNINPRIENKILDEDEDAVVATIVASMEYSKETNKKVRLVSITQSKEE